MAESVITLIGMDGGPLGAVAADRLAAAALVVGAARQLASVEIPTGARTEELTDVRAAVTQLLAHAGPAVVLASGDPGFFGIVRRLRAAGAPIEVLPAVSSVALAFARAGVEWDDARVVSAHGRDARPALAAVRAGGKLAVLTDATTGPRQVAAAAPAGARVVVAERLGAPDERVVTGTAAEIAGRSGWREPNLVLVLDGTPPADPPWQTGKPVDVSGWALPDEAFAHRGGMVTKAEVRALALARLGPRPGVVIWDVGAGSGSVGIECARLGAAVIAVERGDTQLLHANVAAFGVSVQVVQGAAPAVLSRLPDPDAAFVGGGGPDVVRAVAARAPSRVVVALATVERVGPVLAALSDYTCETRLMQACRLEPLAAGHRLAPTNPVFVVSGTRR